MVRGPSSGYGISGGRHIHQRRSGRQDLLDGSGVGILDVAPNGVIQIVFETSEKEAQIAVTVSGRSPVQVHDPSAIGLQRLGKTSQSDVYRIYPFREHLRKQLSAQDQP